MLPYLWMLGGCASFALMGTVAHLLGEEAHCDWQVVAVARAGMALGFAFLIARAAGVKLVLRGPRSLWIRGLAGSVSMVATFYALTRLPVAQVLTVTQMFPIWVALLSWPLLGEAPGWSAWLAVASAVVGVIVIQDPARGEGNFALVAAGVASLFTAVAMLGLHRLRNLDPWAIVVHFSAIALVFCIASLFLFERRIPLERLLAPRPLLLLLTLGITATAGQLFLTRAFAAGSPTRVSVVGLMQIVFALPLDLLLGKHFPSQAFMGIALIIAPTACLMIFRSPAEPGAAAELVASGAEFPQSCDAT
jgi:drug/metabolite transporter (DMT)-like permease